MNTLLKAARQALEVLKYVDYVPRQDGSHPVEKAITELSAAINEAETSEAGAPPYDQQALELCEECGWKAVIPGEQCLVCERNAKLLAVPKGLFIEAEATP